MSFQSDLRAALERDRDELVRVLAAHRVLPTVVERSSGSTLLGKPAAPTVALETAAGESGVTDRQTTVRVVDALGLADAADCAAVREAIEGHAAWGEA